jgi:enamine deaminase RidA (YjgF/YER057c/UK114 family)
MRRRTRAVALGVAALVLVGRHNAAAQKKKYEEPKSQVLPLPRELPMALAADTAGLDFHVSPLLKTGGLAAQIRQSLNDLLRDTHGETIIKLRAFVAGAGDARRVQAETTGIFSEHRVPLPVVSIIQVGALGFEPAKVVIEAVVATHRPENPGGLAFVAGQIGRTLPEALAKLQASASAAGVPVSEVLSTTCFTSRMESYEATRASIQGIFPKALINVVQALRDPLSDASMCQAVGRLPEAPAASAAAKVTWLSATRVTLVRSPQLIFTGMQLTFGNFLDDAHQAFLRLQRVASSIQPVQAPVQVNAFSLSASAGSAVSKTTSYPQSTFTVQTVEGLPAIDASSGIEAILAPNVSDPVTLQQ